MKALKEASRFLLAAGIMFCSIALALSVFTRTTLLNDDFYISSLEKSGYFTCLGQEIDDSFRNYSLITSIPAEVFMGAVSAGEIENLTKENIVDTMSYMRHEAGYAVKKIDATGIDSAIRKYATGITGESSQLSTVTKEAAAIVNSRAVLFDVSRVEKYSQFQSLREAVYIVYKNVYAIAGTLVLLAVLLFVMTRKKEGSYQLWIGGALLAASVVLLVPSLMGLAYGFPYRFSVGDYYLKVALSGFALGYLRNLIISGLVMLLGGIAMLYIGILKAPPLNSKT